MTFLGLLLAAGAGSRMGRPKALVSDVTGEPWSARAVAALRAGGCDDVLVVLGAAADEALTLLPPGTRHVVAEDWADGMSASLRCGLQAATATGADAVVLTLVDLPDVGSEVVARVVSGAGPGTLARATYAGRPGHPVVIGREHWPGVLASLEGDTGAKAYLDAHDAASVECDDLASGRDVDRLGEPTD